MPMLWGTHQHKVRKDPTELSCLRIFKERLGHLAGRAHVPGLRSTSSQTWPSRDCCPGGFLAASCPHRSHQLTDGVPS